MQRRQLVTVGSTLLALAGLSACAANPATPHAQQSVKSKKATVVLVHGAWHGGWCWSDAAQRLAASGVHCVAIDLPGHAMGAAFPAGYFDVSQDLSRLSAAVSPLASLTVDDYRNHVAVVVDGLVANGSGPVVLIGHSLGGVTLNSLGETSPQLVRRLVYLTAVMPVAKASAEAYSGEPTFAASKLPPLFIGDPTKIGAIRLNHRSADPMMKTAIKTAFYADVADAKFAAVAQLLTPDEPAAVFGASATVTDGRWGRIARTYIRCAEDQAIPLAAQDQFITEADALTPANRTTVRTLRSSHSPFLSVPDELAQLINEAAST
jgi:pimeloyl-ACP methyl ester carboxylesterase